MLLHYQNPCFLRMIMESPREILMDTFNLSMLEMFSSRMKRERLFRIQGQRISTNLWEMIHAREPSSTS
jgi:Fe-S oxidoreductase